MSASLCNAGHEIVGAVCSRCYEADAVVKEEALAELAVLRKSWGATDLLRMTSELVELRRAHAELEAQSQRDRDAWCRDVQEKVEALRQRDAQARLFAEAENRAWVLRGERDGALKKVESLKEEASSQRILELSLKSDLTVRDAKLKRAYKALNCVRAHIVVEHPTPTTVRFVTGSGCLGEVNRALNDGCGCYPPGHDSSCTIVQEVP